MDDQKRHIIILGGGQAGLSLIKDLREQGAKAKITLIDKTRYFFDKKDLCPLLLTSRSSEIIDRESFCKEYKTDFICDKAERINFKTRKVFFKEKAPLNCDILVISCGLSSRDLDIRGDQKEGFFYLSDIEIFTLRDHLSRSRDIIISAAGFCGLKLAYFLSFLNKDIKLLTGDCSFLRGHKEQVWEKLAERNIDVYENVSLLEIVGERSVKAVKTSLPRVFSAHLVLVDSGLTSVSRLLANEQDPVYGQTGFPGVYMIGSGSEREAEQEYFFSGYSRSAQGQAAWLASVLENCSEQGEPPLPGKEDIDIIVNRAFEAPQSEVSLNL